MLKAEKRRKAFLLLGLVLFLGSVFCLFLVVYPIVKSEVVFYLNKNKNLANANVSLGEDSPASEEKSNVIVVKDKEFGLVIPKLGINVSVIQDVNPQNPKEYQKALSKGVAHAKGTSTPDALGNTFLFAHSSDTFLNANRYNAIFYLLNKMEPNDLFYVAYKGRLYKYFVVEKKVVAPTQIEYYHKPLPDYENTLTLMTCWPPATTLKRLVVVGALSN